jgi:Leucine-rich repeat (LRR) protein
LQAISQDTLTGIESSLVELDLSFNALNFAPKFGFPKLAKLDLSRNNISRLQEEPFGVLQSLRYLNLSDNSLERINSDAFQQVGDKGSLTLEVLDLSNNMIKDVQPGSFKLKNIIALDLHANMLKEITTGVFVEMPELRFLDLSANDIYSMKPASFDQLGRLIVLKLDENNLASFKEETFTGSTDLEEISLNGNQITYLLSDAFVKHPKLRKLELSHNRLNAFPGEIVRGIRSLEDLTLAHNSLKALENLDFASMPNLRSLNLSHNQLGFVGEAALQNSTQLQYLDLSYNKIKELPENAFFGVGRLLLNLEGNELVTLPPAIFDRNKLFQLHSINLARNALEKIPIEALQRQYFFLQEVDFSHNKIADIQSNANILVNIKKLDLSYNPLTPESVDYILNEPKTARDLNMAGTGIKRVPVLETPFLRKLNLSDNKFEELTEEILQRPTLLEILDVSYNKIPNLSFGLASIWPKLTDLRAVHLAGNPVNYIIKGDFAYLANLEVLTLENLPECTKIEKGAFTGLRKVTDLTMHTYPKVGILDTKGILSQFRAPRSIRVEVKNSVINDDLHTAYSPRLERLELTGGQVRSISTGALAGINSPRIDIKIYNTSVPSLPSPIFFPVPMSSEVSFDVTNNEIASLSPQVLSTLEDKQRQIKLKGLKSNPIYCDCNTRPLKKWLLAQKTEKRLSAELEEVKCGAPAQNVGKKLIEISDGDLSCQGGSTTTTTSEIPLTTQTTTERSEPDIIWTVDPTETKEKERAKAAQAAKNDATRRRDKMDHLIFGILGGVLAFILILVFIICLVRLRISNSHYPGGPLVGPLALQTAPPSLHHTLSGKCTCIKPPPPQPYLYYPPPMTPLPPASIGGTLPKMLPPPPPPTAHSVYGSLHRRGGYYSSTPYYVTFPNEGAVNPGCDSRERESPYEC